MFFVLWKKSKFFIFDHAKSQNGPYLAETEKCPSKFFICCTALDRKLEMDTKTLVLQSGQKFMCFIVHFYEKFWFWHQTGIVPENVYARIWQLLEITFLQVLGSLILV